MNTVATIEPSTLIPAATLADIQRLDKILSESREIIQHSQPMTRAFATAAAMRELEAAITPAMMQDIQNLMNSPLGFKTDRKEGTFKKVQKDGKWFSEPVKPYLPVTIKRCVIVALLAGAELAGNQFNIIAGQTYFTKEFMQKAVLSFRGLSHFKMEIGPPMRHGEKTACFDAKASWLVNGEEFDLACTKQADGVDMRIVVNSHSTSGPDQLRGLAESKLLRRVVSMLTGLNLENDGDQDFSNDHPTTEGKLASNVRIQHGADELNGTEEEEKEEDNIPVADDKPADEADPEIDGGPTALIEAAIEEIQLQETITLASRCAAGRIEELSATEWDDSTKAKVRKSIEAARTERCNEIRKERGESSNKKK